MEQISSQPEQHTEPPKPAGYHVKGVLLLQSSFSREADIDFRNISDLTNDIQFEHIAHETTPNNEFAVTLSLQYTGSQSQKQVCIAEIKMVGIFEKFGEPPLTEDKFKAINAPAIIYPFLREHLHNLCVKAGIANVLLPTINFKPY